MRVTLAPGARTGCVRVPASKSQAHRLLICAAMGERETRIVCDGISRDIAATVACLNALGAEIREDGGALLVRPISSVPETLCHLYCAESGSTLRFLLPVVGALGARAVFHREGRLPERPLAPLDAALSAHGMELRAEGALLYCGGRLRPGAYSIPGNISSQYISGLLLAMPYLGGESRLTVTGAIESSAYITMTEDVLRLADVAFEKQENQYTIPGGQRGLLSETLSVEGDWSNAAFFLCIGALSENGVKLIGMNCGSSQGDRAVLEILRRFGAEIEADGDILRVRRGTLRAQTIDAAAIPDLIPTLSVVAAVAEGESHIINAGRLRMKESDRLQTTAQLLRGLGAEVEELADGLTICGRAGLTGGMADACGDHRIAMAAAVAACACTAPVTVVGADCVEKSYPRFWKDFGDLTGGTV